jgi:hypothetical protein
LSIAIPPLPSAQGSVVAPTRMMPCEGRPGRCRTVKCLKDLPNFARAPFFSRKLEYDRGMKQITVSAFPILGSRLKRCPTQLKSPFQTMD